MRTFAIGLGFWCCMACVERPELRHGTSAEPGADGGADYADASGPLRPADAPLSQAARAVDGVGGAGTGTGGTAAVAYPASVPQAQAPQAGRAGSSAPAPGATAGSGGRPGAGGPNPAVAPSSTGTGAGAGAGAPMAPKPATPARPGQLVITEIMVDPKTLSDTDGEWFELQNTTDTVLDVQGCTIDDGGKEPRPVSTRLIVQPHGLLTIARHDQPGFTPSYVASISLGNAADSLAVQCGDVLIDRVSYDKAQDFPLIPGASMSLDANQTTEMLNDLPSAWCPARLSYGPELGTPGEPNPPCDFGEDAGVDGA